MRPLSSPQRASSVLTAVRVVLCFGLLVLSAYATASEGSWFDLCSLPIVVRPSFRNVVCSTDVPIQFVAASLLTTAPFASRKLRTLMKTVANLLLLALFAIFCYRDLWPLATFTLQPADGFSPAIWTRGLFLALAAVFIPLATPRTYVPVDPSVRFPVVLICILADSQHRLPVIRHQNRLPPRCRSFCSATSLRWYGWVTGPITSLQTCCLLWPTATVRRTNTLERLR